MVPCMEETPIQTLWQVMGYADADMTRHCRPLITRGVHLAADGQLERFHLSYGFMMTVFTRKGAEFHLQESVPGGLFKVCLLPWARPCCGGDSLHLNKRYSPWLHQAFGHDAESRLGQQCQKFTRPGPQLCDSGPSDFVWQRQDRRLRVLAAGWTCCRLPYQGA